MTLHQSVCVCQRLNKSPDPAKTGRKRVSLLGSGAFNRKGKEMLLCFPTLLLGTLRGCGVSLLMFVQQYMYFKMDIGIMK